MQLKNCSICGKIYVENAAKLCPDCASKLDEYELKVGEFLRDNSKANLEEVHKATGVPHKIILQMIQKGRILTDGKLTYPCESCGAPIMEGRVCDDCSKNILSQVKHPDWDKNRQDKKDDERRGGERRHILR